MDSTTNNIVLHAHAKINLSLFITGIREDGYHLLDSVFVLISLHDIVKIKKCDMGIVVKCSDDSLSGKKNIAYKAVQLIAKKYTQVKGVEIDIAKNIPHMAGLGGGSSNAAATLIGINKLYNLLMSNNELMEMALSLGADVPFFIGDGACRVRGVGEVIEPISIGKQIHFTLIKPKASLSTPMVFNEYDKLCEVSKNDCSNLISNLVDGNIEKLQIHNDLQEPAIRMCPEILDEINYLKKAGALSAIMTGSGSCVFGVFVSKQKSIDATNMYKGKSKIFSTTVACKPIEIIKA